MTDATDVRLATMRAILEPTATAVVELQQKFDEMECDGNPVCGLCGGPLRLLDEHSGSCRDCGTFNGEALTPGFFIAVF